MIRLECVLCGNRLEEIRLDAADLKDEGQQYLMVDGVAVIPALCPACNKTSCMDCGEPMEDHALMPFLEARWR